MTTPRQKSPPASGPDAASELPLPPSAGVRPVAGATHATATQLAVALGLPDIEDTFLRNHARDGIPKPIKGKYPINETIIALLKFFHGKLAERDGLPESFDSMQAMENSFLRVPKEFTKWAVKNGAAAAQLGGSRIDPRPVLEKAAGILRLIPTGQVKGVEGFEEWNTNTELAQKLRQERMKLEDEALLRRGQLMLSRDGSFALNEMQVDELIWDMRDQPLRAALVKTPKAINRQLKNLIGNVEISRPCAAVVERSFKEMLDKLRSKIPPAKTDEEKSE